MNDTTTKTNDAKGRGTFPPGPKDLRLLAERQAPNCPGGQPACGAAGGAVAAAAVG